MFTGIALGNHRKVHAIYDLDIPSENFVKIQHVVSNFLSYPKFKCQDLVAMK